MINKDELDDRSKEGTLYESLGENVAEIAELLTKDEPGEDDEDTLVKGAIVTFGYAVVDIAESLDRIADHLEENM